LFHVYDAIKLGIPFKTIHEKTKIDVWFLKQIEDLIKLERRIEKFHLETERNQRVEIVLIEQGRRD
jgi:carbamoyl-phosphate synthase large subunit